jgi:hypothetical protein
MYSINSLKIDEDKIQITVSYESKLIGEKILELSFNEDMTPTFVESGYAYSSEDFESFIRGLESNLLNQSFSFDDQDRFDGFEIITTSKGNKYLIIKTQVERSQTSIWILFTDETIPGIVSDLKFLSKQIKELIDSQKKYCELLSNPFPESDN